MKNAVIILITISLILSVPLTLISAGFLLPDIYGETFMGELGEKVRLLEETEGERIIIVGGSGAAFGVDCALLERELDGYFAVNFGMYAALGTTVMLDLSENLLREGDIVILMPEENAQTLSDYFAPDIMWQGLDGDFRLLGRLPGEKLERLAGAFPAFAAAKLRGDRPRPEGIYRRASFGERGDISAPIAGNVMPGGFDASAPVDFSLLDADEAFVSRVNEYARSARAAGAEVWFAFCPVNSLAVKGSAGELYLRLSEKLELPFIGDPADSVMEPEWFYDTNYHLNSAGKTVFTHRLIGAVKAMLRDPSPTDISLPQPPEMKTGESYSGDDSDAEYFIAEKGVITGLTDEGRGREALTVPTHISGEPVHTIAEGAFSGSGAREIVLQPNVRTIADGAFDGASRLERITLESADPASCRVGYDLMRGTDADIYVPKEALTEYKTDYFWSVYAGRVRN